MAAFLACYNDMMKSESLSSSWVVYAIRSSNSLEQRYVGITTKKLSKRIYLHLWESRKESPRLPVHKWIKSINYDIQVDILASVPAGDVGSLHKLEVEYIKEAKANGYSLLNLTDGGEGTLGYSEPLEIRKKRSENMKGEKNPRFGAKWDDDLRQKIMNALPDQSGKNNPRHGVTLSDETKKKISDNHADVSGDKNPFYGRKHSDETRAKMKASWEKRRLDKQLKTINKDEKND